LSNGGVVHIPAGPNGTAPDDDTVRAHVEQGERQLAEYYGKKAADENAPQVTPGHVYSATTVYPNSYLGHAMAWADHNLGGNWANKNIVQPVDQWQQEHFGGQIEAPVGRVESNAIAGAVDLPATVLNTAKHYIAPERGQEGDIPYVSQSIRQEAGVPELSADAPYWQRVAEAGTAALLGGRSSVAPGVRGFARTLVTKPTFTDAARAYSLAGTGEAGAEVGNLVGGEAGSLIGSIIGAGGGEGAFRYGVNRFGRATAHPDAPSMTADARDLGIEPSSMSGAGPATQRVIKAVGSMPIGGAPVERANTNMVDQIHGVLNQTGRDLAGPGNFPSRVTPETAGTELVKGAQEASVPMKGRQQAVWNNIDRIMADRSVNYAPVASGTETTLRDRPPLPSTAAGVRSTVAEPISTAPGGANYDPNVRGAGPPLPPGASLPRPTLDVPWSTSRDFLTSIKQRLGYGSDIAAPEHIIAAIKTAVQNQMQRATQTAGLRNAFQNASESYARFKPILDTLYKYGGRPVGRTGSFQNEPGGGAAFSNFTKNIQNSKALEPLVDSLSPDRWNSFAGQYLTTLGERTPGNFRPEHMAEDWAKHSDEVQSQLTQGGSSATPLTAADTMDKLANASRNVVTPIARHGLMQSAGALLALHALTEGATELGSHLAGHWMPGLGLLVPAGVNYGLARMFESEPFKRGQAGQSSMSPETRANLLRSALPALGAVTNQNIYDRSRASPANSANRAALERASAIPTNALYAGQPHRNLWVSRG
jgi:hypothetical protein